MITVSGFICHMRCMTVSLIDAQSRAYGLSNDRMGGHPPLRKRMTWMSSLFFLDRRHAAQQMRRVRIAQIDDQSPPAGRRTFGRRRKRLVSLRAQRSMPCYRHRLAREVLEQLLDIARVTARETAGEINHEAENADHGHSRRQRIGLREIQLPKRIGLSTY